MIRESLVESTGSGQVFAGAWHNQHKSEMVLMISEHGELSGSFKVSEKSKIASYPLVGFVSGDMITFCVNFAPHAAVTSWVGHIKFDPSSKESALETLWHMAVFAGNESDMWKSTFSGFDLFQRGPQEGSMLWHKCAPSHPFSLPSR